MAEERPRLLAREVLPELTGRELSVLKGLIADFKQGDFTLNFGIGPFGLKVDKGNIAEKYQGETMTSGIHKAIVDIFRRGLIATDTEIAKEGNTKRFVGDPMMILDGMEREIYHLMYEGLASTRIAVEKNMPVRDVRGVEKSICRKLKVSTTYAAVAWLACEKKRRGEL